MATDKQVDSLATKPLHTGKAETEHDETIYAEPSFLQHVSYGPGGIAGLISSPYVSGAAVLASLGGFSMGYDMGVISLINVMDQFHTTYPFTETSFGKEFMTAMLLLGAFLGCIFMPYMADRYSRKWALTAVVIIFDIGAIIQTAAPNYAALVAGRFIGGIGVGTLAMGAPLYISEISPPNIRGTLLVLESISITSGVVIAFWITFGCRSIAGEGAFRLPFGLQMVTATLLGVGIHFFPYSPRWLALVNRSDDCLKSLEKLRGLPSHDERVQAEFHGIMAEVNFQKLAQQKRHPGVGGIKLEVALWADLFKRKLWRRTAVGVGVAFFQQFSGINAFIYYAPTLFTSLGQTNEMALIMSGVFNILQMVAAIVCFLIIEKVGRRPLAIFGGFGTAVTYTIIAILSALYEKDWQSHQSAGWACVAMAFLFILTYGVSYSPLGWALPSEVYSTATRSKGVALSTCVIWLCDFIIGISVPSMMESITYGTYIFFAVMCFLAGVWAYFLVPETGGKTLEELDEVFGDSSGQEERDLVAEALRAARTAPAETTV
ncbi:hexose carrier protein [Penicillium brasilianum]|uniref:Hexose carrier protein n=1 Tax=Penicillium brasilianum TaxID=104259 RepID=A0A1S9RJY9_PENBI|nr:hexose carrier protein [Penicillium brasilianum]